MSVRPWGSSAEKLPKLNNCRFNSAVLAAASESGSNSVVPKCVVIFVPDPGLVSLRRSMPIVRGQVRAYNVEMKENAELQVLHILGSLRPSGMERMLVSAAEAFKDEGVVTSIYGLDNGSVYIDELRDAGFEVVLGQALSSSVQAVLRLRRFVKKHEIDVIHIHTERNWLQTVLAGRLALAGRRGAIVRTVHSNFMARGRWLASRRAQAFFGDGFAQAFVAPSPDVAEREKSVGRDCQVILNWVDDRFSELRVRRTQREETVGALTAVLVGNCSSVKRHELALEAIWSSGMRLSHIGDEHGASQNELELLERFEKAGRLDYRGVQSPDQALLDGDVYCMPSRLEGFSVAFAEALTVGLPCVVSDSPGFNWARGIDGVFIVPNEPLVWMNTLGSIHHGMSSVIPDGIDLGARRGAREYAALYRRVASR